MIKNVETIESDSLVGVGHPRTTEKLFGHFDEYQTFAENFRTGNIHHAWLIIGPQGIGKATLAWKLVNLILEENREFQNLGKATNSAVAKQIAALSAPGLFLCRRQFDEKLKRVKKQISINEIRKMKSFFNFSETEKGWKVAIIDSADELSISASNALLKLIEEPPRKTIFLLICHQFSKILPTVRSRCRLMRLKPITNEELCEALTVNGFDPQRLEPENLKTLYFLCKGSVGSAIHLLQRDGVSILLTYLDIIAGYPNMDRSRILSFADKVTEHPDGFFFLTNIIKLAIYRIGLIFAGREVQFYNKCEKSVFERFNKQKNIALLWAEIFFEFEKSFSNCALLNLDPKLEIINSFVKLEKKLKENAFSR